MSDTPENTAPDEVIVCPVTPWFFKRMGILAAMLLGMGAYFFYDGKVGYPAKNEIARKKVWFETEFLASFDAAKKEGRLDQWIAQASAAGMPTGEGGEAPKWRSYAARQGWPEEIKKYSDEEIEQQFWWAGAVALGGFAVLMKILLDRKKTLVGHADHMVMPDKVVVPFADAFKVDKRNWDVKALAYVFYKVNGGQKRAVVDDLKYEGAGRVLDRLLANFRGELIEKKVDDAPPEEVAADDKK